MNKHYIPSLTNHAGLGLTIQDWLSVDITMVACDLASVLVRPGISVLSQFDNLSCFWNWPGKIVLNFAAVTMNSKGFFEIRSPDSGEKLMFTDQELINIVKVLGPDYLLFTPALLPILSKHFDNYLHDFQENNQPSEDALKGVVYTKDGYFFILDPQNEKKVAPLDDTCQCPACNNQMTCAYFFHLYRHVPLLSQRWLIMHNQWMKHHGPERFIDQR